MLPYFFATYRPLIAFIGVLTAFGATCLLLSKCSGLLPKDQGRDFAVEGKNQRESREARELFLCWYLRWRCSCLRI